VIYRLRIIAETYSTLGFRSKMHFLLRMPSGERQTLWLQSSPSVITTTGDTAYFLQRRRPIRRVDHVETSVFARTAKSILTPLEILIVSFLCR
jgi:hypothetical protein